MNFVQFGRKIVCVGRNYVMHAKELGNPIPEKPVLFLKPTTSYLIEGQGPIQLPLGAVVHHEVELGLVIGKGGKNIAETDAWNHVSGIVCALDLTARNFQEDAKAKGLPWLEAKCWDTFSPVSKFVPLTDVKEDIHALELSCFVNGERRQFGNTKDMLFPVPAILRHISRIMTLEEGDLIMTGTPAGVGPLVAGDEIKCSITNVVEMTFQASNEEA
jgi:acylpyruvate hydrolase